ncbi:hypothetical protein HMPREF3291_09355 [Bacillus sp. HMSC76G11]|uniref:hypothetical protein n=1 Tax=Metabacillus idriensis TaxID=324768 RepID=UPI0008A9F4EE|nr:hypothetical protein [Metabacillus idriensis]OHR68299.1 hypothetical protein HMPREF3291_09355 [Bacillus sp. HMSC76G11]
MVKIIKPIKKTRILPYAYGISLGKSAVRQTGWMGKDDWIWLLSAGMRAWKFGVGHRKLHSPALKHYFSGHSDLIFASLTKKALKTRTLPLLFW